MRTKVIGVLVAVFMATALFGGMVYAAPPAEEAGAVNYRDPETVKQLLTDLGKAANQEAWFAAQPGEARAAIIWASEAVTEEITHTTSSYGFRSSDDDPICRDHSFTRTKENRLGWTILSYKSRTWWCRLNGKIHGDPSFSTTGKVHGVFRATWRYIGDDTSEKTSPDRTWHKDEGTGKFDNCLPRPAVCVRAWEPNIKKKHYGNGRQTP